jgi:hypothetical protein
MYHFPLRNGGKAMSHCIDVAMIITFRRINKKEICLAKLQTTVQTIADRQEGLFGMQKIFLAQRIITR